MPLSRHCRAPRELAVDRRAVDSGFRAVFESQDALRGELGTFLTCNHSRQGCDGSWQHLCSMFKMRFMVGADWRLGGRSRARTSYFVLRT